MARSDFNIGQETKIDFISNTGSFVDVSGLIDFHAMPVNSKEESFPITDGGRGIRRTIYKGWHIEMKFDRQSETVDNIQNQLEAAFFNGQAEQYFSIQETIRTPNTGQIRVYQYEECCFSMKDHGNMVADKKVEQTLELYASRRTQLA